MNPWDFMCSFKLRQEYMPGELINSSYFHQTYGVGLERKVNKIRSQGRWYMYAPPVGTFFDGTLHRYLGYLKRMLATDEDAAFWASLCELFIRDCEAVT
jgi:hypothetical protein